MRHGVAAALAGLLGVFNPIAFTTVHHGTQSRIEDARQVAVLTASEWRSLWKAHAPSGLPPVDFEKDMVVGVFLGTRPTGGYAVEIVAVESTGGEIVVTYRENTPGRDGMVTQALTSPVHLVRIPRQRGTLRFVRAK